MPHDIRDRYDALVIGGGIAGMQAALDLGEQGFEVLLVERTPSIGGMMVGLNKVFPTLDCSSCICTPRMAESAHHPRIRLQTYTEVRKVEPCRRRRSASTCCCKPRYLHEDTCIGCDECELACPVDVPHEFDYGLGARRAIYIPHGNAIPQKAVLDVEHCIFCGKCEKVCPTDCLDFTQEPVEVTTTVGAVIVATGPRNPADDRQEAGVRRRPLPNVMSPLAMERIQSSNGPYGRVLRPGRRQDSAVDRLHPVRRQPRPLDRRAVLLARLLHVRAQAGAAAPALHPRRRRHALLHGHPRVRQGLRAVLPPGGRRRREGRQGQGGADHRGADNFDLHAARGTARRGRPRRASTATISSSSARA